MENYRCVICGYIHVGNPPQSCPVCGASAAEMEIYKEEITEKKQPKSSLKCLVCGYIHEGSDLPDSCPVCGVKSDMFESYQKEQAVKTKAETLKVVIIGGGIAGLSCAEEIRNHSEEAVITIITEDSLLPYYRLNLTRYLAKETAKESLTIYSLNWYDEKRIKLMTGMEVTEIDKDNKKIKLKDGTSINYDKLVIANGAHPFIPPIPGKDLKNVIAVRNLKDADYILDKTKEIDSCICIGGGILGIEAAGAIAKSGVKVTLLEGAEWLMPRQLNSKAAVLLKKYLKNIGIEVKENIKIQEIYGGDECEGVKLSTGEVFPSKLIVVTAGVRPNTHLARKAGLEVNMGLIVDNHMKTSEEDIFAAGDITEHYGTLYGLWSAAQFQGKIAGQNVVGLDTQFGGIPRSNVLKVKHKVC